MALIRKNEFRNMKEEQLKSKLSDLNLELIKLNAQRAIGTALESPGKIKAIRKTIAQINTKLTQLKKEIPKEKKIQKVKKEVKQKK